MFSNKKKNHFYSLRKARRILSLTQDLYWKKHKKLSLVDQDRIKKLISKLEIAIKEKDKATVSGLACELFNLSNNLFPRTLFSHAKEIVIGLTIALVIATLIRQMWFENYEIPTGSMRPTFLEQDRLIASKTTAGINVPFKPDHFYFNPNLLQRGSIIIFTIENMNVSDSDTHYFYFFPGKKRLIKRLIGKPGDTLYFYGGKVYGIDKDHQDLKALREDPHLDKLEYLPFLNFSGKVTASAKKNSDRQIKSPVIIHQMNQPIAKLIVKDDGAVSGKIFNGSAWVDETDANSYKSLWGIGNFAMTRFLSKQEAQTLAPFNLKEVGESDYYLQLFHSPAISKPKPHLGIDLQARLRPMLNLETSLIPLDAKHIEALKKAMYTSRFVIKNGYAYAYHVNQNITHNAFSPYFPGIEDGTYEFYYGKAYQIRWSGIRSELPEDHPFNNLNPEMTQKLFNVGMQMLTLFEPHNNHQIFHPGRFTYFRDGDLYVMGNPIMKKGEPALEKFMQFEMQRSEHSSYHPFIDYGPPLKDDGSIDVEFIKAHGLKVPDKHYLGLGDNHANSNDCRDFGFIPEANIRGNPSFIMWPPGPRVGAPNQKGYKHLTLPKTIICSSLFGVGIIWYSIHRLRKRRKF